MTKQTEEIEALLKEISPFPWVYTSDSNGCVYVDDLGMNSNVCDLYHLLEDRQTVYTKPNAEANAKFIAAAPEIITSLLEQIKELKELNIYLAGLLNENYEQIKQKDMEIKHLYSNPPCRECGAMTEKEAETKCNCSGDKDYCHGCELWDK